MKNSDVKKIGLLAGGALALSLGAQATNSFDATDLGSAGELRSELLSTDATNHMVLNSEVEFSCGEGKCGEGKCGEKKADKKKEAKGDEHKCGEGKCGEGKCGEKSDKKKKESKGDEHKCGEGKCGE